MVVDVSVFGNVLKWNLDYRRREYKCNERTGRCKYHTPAQKISVTLRRGTQ